LRSDALWKQRSTGLPPGLYGCCLQCDEEIGMKRLTALPHAVSCITCQESAEQSESRWPDVLKELAGIQIGTRKMLWRGLEKPDAFARTWCKMFALIVVQILEGGKNQCVTIH
jgi:hypothetical protein